MEAPQGVQLTGTNRPRTYHKTLTTHPLCSSWSTAGTGVTTTTPPTTQLHTSYGGHSGGETPGPIPNPEAKPSSADGTAPARVWESRTPPNTNPPLRGPQPPRGPLSFLPGQSGHSRTQPLQNRASSRYLAEQVDHQLSACDASAEREKQAGRRGSGGWGRFWARSGTASASP